MSGALDALVFDTGPLSHFARAGWLGALRAVVGKRLAIIPDAVTIELKAGTLVDTRLQPVLDADWIQRRELRSRAELSAYG